jgi:LacI family transcriptional regulator
MKPKDGISVVSIDNYLGGRMATTHLLEQGYKHIAHISGPLDWWEARQRKAAWADVLQEGGLEIREEGWTEGNWSSSSGVYAFEKLLTQYPEMDAVFVANDQMALSVMQVAGQKRLRIPDDLGIVGFDNIPESPYFSTPLTTVDQEQYNFAKLAVQEIIKTIESNWGDGEPDAPKTIILPPKLIVRQSSTRRRE